MTSPFTIHHSPLPLSHSVHRAAVLRLRRPAWSGSMRPTERRRSAPLQTPSSAPWGHRMAEFKSDIEIARAAKKKPIQEIGAKARHSRRAPAALRPRQGKDLGRVHRLQARRQGRQADPGHRDQPDAGRRRQDHHDGRPRRRAEPHRQEGDHLHPRGVARAEFRRQGRCRRRRLCAGRADGGHEPPFHRRFPRHHHGAQSALGADRQPHLLGQRARHRHPPHRLAARHGHERPGAARNHRVARRRRQRLSARGGFRHHRRLGGHGDPLPRHRPQGSGEAARRHHRRLPPRQDARSMPAT